METGAEVALAVGHGLDGRAGDGQSERHSRQLVGQEATQRAAYRGTDSLALDRVRGRRVVQNPTAHDQSLRAAVPDVRLDPEAARGPIPGPPQPSRVPGPL